MKPFQFVMMLFSLCIIRIAAAPYQHKIFYIPFTSLSCMRNFNASIEVHILNLPHLSEFLHYDIVKELKADLFLNRTMAARLPKLPIASAEFEHDLQLEEEMSLDLETAINQSKSDT